MPDIADGETVEIQGSAKAPYVLRNVGGVYSCTCPAWRNQSLGIEQRTCKHLKKYRGEAAEAARVGSAVPAARSATKETKAGPPLLLAHRWENDVELDGWWMSEKLDGVRAYWDGKQILSRLGNVYHAPEWFVEQLPDFPLDGELWLDRQQFQRTVSIARRQDKSEHWNELKFVLFDAPGMEEPFEQRIKFLQSHVKKTKPKFATVLDHQACQGLDHLKTELERVEALGGEGLMLRQPGSRYEVGRSTSLLKVKTFFDAEAKVLEYTSGRGRHKGRVGALVVEMPDGSTFSVGTGLSDRMRENPPAVGTFITYRYQELTKDGIPRFPSFVGERSATESDTAASATKRRSAKAKSSATKATKKAAPAKIPKATSTSSPPATFGARYFEYHDAKSHKFWEIAVNECDVTVRYGRCETAGQTKTKTLATADAATQHAEKLIDEKTGKGYEEP